MARKLLPLSIAVATIALAGSYARQGLWLWVAAILATGVVWLAATRPPSRWKRTGWVGPAAFFLFCVAVVAGLLHGLERYAALAALVSALTAWDLDCFLRGIRRVDRVEAQPELERRHLQRLLVADLLGSLAAAAALELRLTLRFGVLLLLALAGALVLSRTIRLLKREGA